MVLPKRHVLYMEVLAILLEIVISMRKRMAKQAELNNKMSKGSGQREIRQVWNNVQRVNHQNQFVPKAILTRTDVDKKNKVLFTLMNVLCCLLNHECQKDQEGNTVCQNTHCKMEVAKRKNIDLLRLLDAMLVDSFFYLTLFGLRKGPTWLFDLDYLIDSMNYQPVRSENQANKHAGPKEANHNAGTEDNINAGDYEIEAKSDQDYFVLPIWSSYTSTVKSIKAKNASEEPNKHPDLKPVDKEDQVFLDELERLKRQEQDANDAAEALRKEFAQETEDLLLQAGAAKASSTNIVNTASTSVCTAISYGGLSFTNLTNTDQDDSEIPALEEIYNNPTDGIFTNASYEDEGAVADFINLETIVNVSPIPTSRINSIHPSTLILRDPKSAVQTRSKVTKSFGAHAF
ncbi:hypothetical protein Tco_0045119, partial [Tanacetum coccineum]